MPNKSFSTFNAFYFCSFQTTNYDSILQTAQSIAKQAHDLAYDPNYMSPFAQFACDNGLNVRGKYAPIKTPHYTVHAFKMFLKSMKQNGVFLCRNGQI